MAVCLKRDLGLGGKGIRVLNPAISQACPLSHILMLLGLVPWHSNDQKEDGKYRPLTGQTVPNCPWLSLVNQRVISPAVSNYLFELLTVSSCPNLPSP